MNMKTTSNDEMNHGHEKWKSTSKDAKPNNFVDNALRPMVEGHIDDMDPKNPLADLKDALKSMLFHFGPDGANKVCEDVIQARKRRTE